MPPYVPRKRLRGSPKPEAGEGAKLQNATPPKRQPTLYDDLDTLSTPQSTKPVNSLLQDSNGENDSDSSLSSLSDEEFEDIPPAKRAKVEAESDDEDVEFEDVAAPAQFDSAAPVVSGDLELTLHKDTRMSLTNIYGDKKGPSKRERKVRNATHCLHVLSLMWHNAVRNSWLCDPEVKAVLVSHLPPKMWDEVERWRRNSGLVQPEPEPKTTKSKGKATKKRKARQEKDTRDWSANAKRLEEGAVDMSHGDPLFRLMQSLASWWKQRFKVTQPGLRKWGYISLERLDKMTKAHREDPADVRFGERIVTLEEFRQRAASCQGSRDTGAQLFTALLRGLGLEARMVANLQPLGFGWSKWEEAEEEKDDAVATKSSTKSPSKDTRKVTPKKSTPKKPKKAASHDYLKLEHDDTDDESVVELEITPKKSKPRKQDGDLEYPHYWTEVLSPLTSKYLAVDSIVKSVIATNRDLVESLEPRGQKADKARQVMAYTVGYSPDGTAKDVTVRYLKRQVMPGRTKGFRMPAERIPVYNRHGKVKRHEQFDWFKTAMSGYKRGTRTHPLTEVDHEEDATDLKPAVPEKKEIKEGEETLQYYKQSKEFVLERHLKREEALKRGAAPVKKFKNKGKGGKTDEEDVYRREDVLQVKSAETWHKQGRAPVEGEEPLKRVPYRAATLNRKREILEVEAATGEKVLQGLYSYEQTDWIIPPPIQNGVIPKNEYGNIDLFAEHMCPRGAVHVPFRGTMRVCKRLQIDYAEAVVDFEFGHRMAVPVIQGVVIAEEYHDQVMAELEKDEAERRRKEDEKRRKAALGQWRKFIMGLRIVERMRIEYGEVDDSVSVFGHRGAPASKAADHDMAGGFLPEGYEEVHEEEQTSSFFPVADEDEDDSLLVEHG